MKNRTLRLFAGVLLSVITSGHALANVNHNLTDSSGYPYRDLVQRFDEVKIRYSDADELNRINCSVEVKLQSQGFTASTQTARAKDFDSTPLKTCISRGEAIELLAKTF